MDPFTFVYYIYRVYLSTYLPIHLSTYLSYRILSFLSINLSIYPSIHPSIYLSLYLSIHLSIHLSIYLPIYLSIYATFVLLASRAGPRVSPRRRVAQCGGVAGWQVPGDRRGGWAGRAGSRRGPGDGESRNGGLNDGDMWFNYVFHGGKRG